MNERIKELAEQATEYVQHVFTTQETYFDKEKFAEFIVKEVLSKIDDEGFEVYKPVVEAVQKHFGVE